VRETLPPPKVKPIIKKSESLPPSTPLSPPVPSPTTEIPQKPELAVPQKPIDDILDEGLPTIRVMPQRPEDVHKQMRQTVVQFGEE
jgi:hypothetical protein